jgi:hypothetical protein
LHGLQCGLSQPQTHHWIHRLLPVLRYALAALGLTPERDARRVAHAPLAREGGSDGAIDGSERVANARPTRRSSGRITAGKRKPIRTKTFCWSTKTPAKWSIWDRPCRARCTTRKPPTQRRSPIHATPGWTRTRGFKAMSRTAC